ncbi:MAG TPA: biopolymer transporter ExbD [Kofleriaceae bacterium]|jgi:biopolymer transport protein ExbD|nr:biopolymer transporter ExbD [Kofleriaceae bacterium]
MAASIGTGSKGSVNVELNIIPFVDVMSCLTAFLLVTAVWVNTAHLKNSAQGRGRDSVGEPPPTLSVLIERDSIRVEAKPTGEARQLPAFDWAQLETAMKEINPAPSGEQPHVLIAADSTNADPISYQQLIAAMDTSVRAGFSYVGVVDPRSL